MKNLRWKYRSHVTKSKDAKPEMTRPQLCHREQACKTRSGRPATVSRAANQEEDSDVTAAAGVLRGLPRGAGEVRRVARVFRV